MKRYKIIVVGVLWMNLTYSQFTCMMPSPNIFDTNYYKSNVSDCSSIDNYSLYPHPEYSSIKTIRISFNVFQKSDGSGSYIGTEQEIRDYFHALISLSNERLSDLAPHDPASPPQYCRL